MKSAERDIKKGKGGPSMPQSVIIVNAALAVPPVAISGSRRNT